MRWPLAIIIGYYALATRANTEIANFAVARTDRFTPSPLISGWPTLDFASRERKFILVPGENGLATVCDNGSLFPANHCPHQTWVVCNTNAPEWQRFSAFTLRLSWPASQPAQFDISIFDGAELFNQTTDSRMRYARIAVLKNSVQVPSISSIPPDPTVAFHLILEPLHFGLLPASLMPLLWLTIPVLIVAYAVAQKVNSSLSRICRLIDTKAHSS